MIDDLADLSTKRKFKKTCKYLVKHISNIEKMLEICKKPLLPSVGLLKKMKIGSYRKTMT